MPVRKQGTTQYKPEMCAQVLALGSAGFKYQSIVRMLEVSQKLFKQWMSEHQEFFDSVTQAKELARQFHLPSGGMGRPIKYRPEMCQQVIDLGMAGYSKAQIAREIGVVRQTLYDWGETYPDFLGSLTRAEELSMAWWEDKAHSGIDVQGFNSGLWGRVMSARFPADYREVSRSELTGKDGAPLPVAPSAPLLPSEVQDAVKAALDKFNSEY